MRERLLVVASRGVSARQRHLLEDLTKIVPHHKKEPKIDKDVRALNEICEERSCTGALYLEARRTSLYLWLGRLEGPSVKFQVVNVHTMDELRLTGNCGLGMLLSFDAKFDKTEYWRVVKSILTLTFRTPRKHPKAKPFFDHVLSFVLIDDKVWVRHYQIAEETLVEIGPRFVLSVMRIMAGPFSGPTLFLTKPDAVSSRDDNSYVDKKRKLEQRREHVKASKPDVSDLHTMFRDD